MTLFLSCMLVLLTSVGAAFAQAPPPSAPWNVTIKTNTVADSTLTVANRCKKNHQFQIQLENVPFLQLSQNQDSVKGGQTQVVPVKFDTRNLAPGIYQGKVFVNCLSCKTESTCTQDRDVLQVVLNVPSEAPVSGSPGQANLSLDLGSLREAEAAAKAAADKARQAAATAEQDARNAQAQADAARKAVVDAVKEVNKASDAVAEAEKERDRANREGTTAEREAARAALERAKADLAAKEKALKDAQAVAAGNPQAAAHEDAKKAAEEKAEAEKAAAALAVAQAAVAEKEKEILKAQQEAAAAQAAKEKEAREARARADAKVAADKAAQEKLWAEDRERRRQEEINRAARATEIDYLLDNIRKLGLITYKPKTNVPDPLDYVFDKLRQLAGQTTGDFLQTVAGEIGGSDATPAGVIGALGELYKSIGSFFDPRTGVGQARIVNKLQGMTNPNTNPPRKYNEKEAFDKLKKMQDLMKELQNKLAAAQAAAK